jgi:hypothetical protein
MPERTTGWELNRAISYCSERQPIELLGLKCDIVPPQKSDRIYELRQVFDREQIGEHDHAYVSFMYLETWFGISDRVRIPIGIVSLIDGKLTVGYDTYVKDEWSASGSRHGAMTSWSSQRTLIEPVSLNLSPEEFIEALPVSAKLRAIIHMVKLVLDARVDHVIDDAVIDYIGEPAALIRTSGEKFGLLRLITNGHIDLTALVECIYIARIKRNVSQVKNEIVNLSDVQSESPIVMNHEYVMDLGSIAYNVGIQANHGHFDVALGNLLAMEDQRFMDLAQEMSNNRQLHNMFTDADESTRDVIMTAMSTDVNKL